VSLLEKKKAAENEKIKGNEHMKTKEFDEALKCYNNSIKLDSDEATTFCNRALAYIKLKRNFTSYKFINKIEFEKGLNDCNKAISLKNDYSKAYYRRAICLLGLKMHRKAFDDLLFVLKDSPTSQEILEELNNLKGEWKKDVGNEEWSKISNRLDEEILRAKEPSNKNKIMVDPYIKYVKENEVTKELQKEAPEPSKTEGGFKKIKIVEESVEDNKMEVEEDVDQDLSIYIYIYN
jgi:tetratricopeptide (TPR) repeat protein